MIGRVKTSLYSLRVYWKTYFSRTRSKTCVCENVDVVKNIANGNVNQLKPISSGVNSVSDENEYRLQSVQSTLP